MFAPISPKGTDAKKKKVGALLERERLQEYTEELYKKDLHDLDNHNGVITDLEPDILECEIKRALASL